MGKTSAKIHLVILSLIVVIAVYNTAVTGKTVYKDEITEGEYANLGLLNGYEFYWSFLKDVQKTYVGPHWQVLKRELSAAEAGGWSVSKALGLDGNEDIEFSSDSIDEFIKQVDKVPVGNEQKQSIIEAASVLRDMRKREELEEKRKAEAKAKQEESEPRGFFDRVQGVLRSFKEDSKDTNKSLIIEDTQDSKDIKSLRDTDKVDDIAAGYDYYGNDWSEEEIKQELQNYNTKENMQHIERGKAQRNKYKGFEKYHFKGNSAKDYQKYNQQIMNDEDSVDDIMNSVNSQINQESFDDAEQEVDNTFGIFEQNMDNEHLQEKGNDIFKQFSPQMQKRQDAIEDAINGDDSGYESDMDYESLLKKYSR